MSASQNGRTPNLSNKQLSLVVEALLNCPVIKDKGARETVISRLPQDIMSAIKRNDLLRTEVVNIVQACLDYPEGLDALTEAICLLEGNTPSAQHVRHLVSSLFPGMLNEQQIGEIEALIAQAGIDESVLKNLYLESVTGWGFFPEEIEPNSLHVMITKLSDMPQQVDGLFPILEFVSLVLKYTTNRPLGEKIVNWTRAAAMSLGVDQSAMRALVDQAKRHTIPQNIEQYYLIILLKPSELNEQQFYVRAWLVSSNRTTNSSPRFIPLDTGESAEILYSYEQLGEVLDTLLDLVHDYIWNTEYELTLEFFVPINYLNFGLDQIAIKDVTDQPVRVGIVYQVALRSYERLSPRYIKRMLNIWKKKWQKLQTPTKDPGTILWLHRVEDCVRDALHAKMYGDEIAILSLTLDMAAAGDIHGDIFSVILSTAMPVALWTRTLFVEEEEAAQEVFASILANGRHVPRATWETRRNAVTVQDEKHLGLRVSLLWEDPNRLPPDALPEAQYHAPKRGAS